MAVPIFYPDPLLPRAARTCCRLGKGDLGQRGPTGAFWKQQCGRRQQFCRSRVRRRGDWADLRDNHRQSGLRTRTAAGRFHQSGRERRHRENDSWGYRNARALSPPHGPFHGRAARGSTAACAGRPRPPPRLSVHLRALPDAWRRASLHHPAGLVRAHLIVLAAKLLEQPSPLPSLARLPAVP